MREERKSAEEWMGQLRIKANECNYEKRGKRLKEQLINGINDDDMITMIIREFTVTKKTKEIMNGKMLGWAQKVEGQIS